MKAEQKKELAPQTPLTQTAIAINDMAQALASGVDEFGLSANDIRIETLLMMQPASGMVSERKAKLGDIIRNESEKIIGGIDNPIEVIALYKFETVRIYAAADGKFLRETPYNPLVRLVKEGIEDGIPVKRYHTINFFFLLVSDIEAGEFFPVLMRFKSTSFKAGSKFASFLYKKKFFNNLPYDFTGIISAIHDKNEQKQHWAFLDFKEGRATTDEERTIARQMVALINAKKETVMAYASQADSQEESSHAPQPVVVNAEVIGQAQGDY
jgi:hypothetical protein